MSEQQEEISKHLAYINRKWPHLPLYLRSELYLRVKFFDLNEKTLDFMARYGWLLTVVLLAVLIVIVLSGGCK